MIFSLIAGKIFIRNFNLKMGLNNIMSTNKF